MTYPRDPYGRPGRFEVDNYAPSFGSDFGFDEAMRDDPLNKKFVQRNLKEYKTLRKFSKKGGLKKLRKMNYAQMERLATRAVLNKNNVKRRKLRTSLNKKKFKQRHLNIARRKIDKKGFDVRRLGQQGKDVDDIKWKQVRKAAKHIIQTRRNRAIMKTPIWSGKGIDIKRGHITLRQAKRANYWRSKWKTK